MYAINDYIQQQKIYYYYYYYYYLLIFPLCTSQKPITPEPPSPMLTLSQSVFTP